MSVEQLEQRVAALEAEVAKLRQETAGKDVAPHGKKWSENLGPPMTDDERRAYDEAAPYRAYIRRTGSTPPAEWKPGDPIPEPDHWQ